MAADLGIGLPIEHTIRTCLLGLELGRRAGMSVAERSDLYYLTLLRMLGCTAGSRESAEHFTDEIAFGRDTQHLDYGDPEAFGRWVMESFGAERPPEQREQMVAKLFAYTPERRQEYLAGHCEVAQMLATRLGLPGSVTDGLAFVFERWDGRGAPNGIPGEQQPLAARVMNLCNELEVHHRLGGVDAAIAVARTRAGGAFDPGVVGIFCSDPAGILGVLDQGSAWTALLEAEPAGYRRLDAQGCVEAGRVIADFSDLKSTFMAHHSARVAGLVMAAAGRRKVDRADLSTLHLAALTLDLGRVTVSNAVWDKPSPLNESEWEKVRLHPYYSERMLSRAPSLADAAAVAGMHHERLDGSGYHRASSGASQSAAGRLLAAADAYQGMREPRAHRPAHDPERAGDELRRQAQAGILDVASVNAVLAAAGDTSPPVRRSWPAGLSDREVDVLRRVALGGSIQAAAAELHIAPKTVDFHLQNIYSKAGVTTRAAAALFAIQNGLLEN